MSDEAVLKLFAPGSYDLVPHDGMRKTIARRLTESKQTVPHFYVSVDCVLENLLPLRERLNLQAPKDKDGKPAWKVSVNDFIIKAMAMALMKVPDANVSWTENAMVKHHHADVGVAVSIPGGLITPVVRKAETKGLTQISMEMKDYAARARTRRLKPEEYTGGSTSVSNLGMMNIKNFAAIVNPPQATILAVGAGILVLGLGLALPFLGLGFIPALRRMMPKPGAWMATFQRILAIPMALTVAALLWLLWRQTGLTGLKIGIAGALLVTLLGWLAGRRQPLGLSLLPAFGALAVVAAVAMPFLFTLAPTHSSIAAGTEPFSETRLVALRQANKPVFLYFTADWCLTCKVNEKAAIDRAETRAAFEKAGVTVMVGDWTNGDPAITRFLEARGRSGVPLYLWYPKGGGEPTELPQVLTPGLLAALPG